MSIMESPKGEVRQFDDFLGSTLNSDLWVATASTNGTAAITDVEIDGTVQIDADATDGDAAQLAGNLNWRVQDGSLRMETRVKFTPVTTLRFNIGFSDATSETDTIPIKRSTTTWDSTATDFIGFTFDTDASNDYITAFWVDDGADTGTAIGTLEFAGLAPVANTYYTYIVELQDAGSGNQVYATLSILDNSGKIYQKEFASTIDRDAVLLPYIGIENATGAVHEATIDYLDVTKSRAVSID